MLLFARAKRRPRPGRGKGKIRREPPPPRRGGTKHPSTKKEERGAAAPQCYASVTTSPIPLTNEYPRVKLPLVKLETPCLTVLPGADTGPASHGMCAGADRRVEYSEVCKFGVRGLIRAVLSKKFATFLIDCKNQNLSLQKI